MPHLASNPQNSCFVFASAGSGKTKILTDRVIRLLLAATSPNKILCLTFTKAAAAEMESRINATLASWMLLSDEELQQKLFELSGKNATQDEMKKARTLFVKIIDDEAKIKVQTIHAFCQSLMKIFPFEAKIKPNFEVLEESQKKLLIKQAQKNLFQKEELQNLIKKISAKINDEDLLNLALEIISKKEKLFDEKEIFQILSVSKDDDEKRIFQNFLEKIDQKQILQLALSLEQSTSSKNSEIAEKIRKFFKNPILQNFSTYQSAFLTDKNEPRKIYGKTDELLPLMEEQQNLIAEFNEKINSLKIANDSALLLKFSNEILRNYSALKKQKAVLDYDDLILETNKLLANPDFSSWVKMKMDSSFDHILVDESQDTNHEQWNIIKALSDDFFSGLGAGNKERSIFIVGDEKQSIYSFQGSDANISEEIFSYFSQKLGDKLKRIELHDSYRSTATVLEAVDRIFTDEERKKSISKVSNFKKHNAVRTGAGVVEIWPQIKNEKAKEEKNYEWQIDFSLDSEAKEREILAEIIATKVKNWVENKRQISARNRSVNYGDIMILLRNRTNGLLEELVRFFHHYQIPFNSIAKVKFSESLLIQDLLAAARFVLLPQDDLNLACLLKSPIFNVSEEQLLKICNGRKATVYKALKDSELKNKLDEITQKSQQLNCFEFFYFLLHEKNHQKNFLSYFGHESLEILDKFLILTADFCKNNSPNLQKFLEFVEKTDPEIALSGDEENAVKITTIHSAKGLQAPVVILPDCAFDFKKLPATKAEICWINDLPLWCAKKADENQIIKSYREQKFYEAKDEYLRLFYVAMTRAADELYIGGFGKASDKESWHEIAKNALPECVIAEDKFQKEEVEKILKQVQDDDRQQQLHSSYSEPVEESLKSTQSQINPAQIKGRIIHKILEIFGKNHHKEKAWLKDLAQKLLQKEEFLDEKEKNEISDLINEFLASEHFKKIFSGDVKCEVEIANEGNFGRIDLLSESENEITIIDYKSDESLPDKVPQQYVNQLKNYEKLVRALNSQKKISCAILWLRFLRLDFI